MAQMCLRLFLSIIKILLAFIFEKYIMSQDDVQEIIFMKDESKNQLLTLIRCCLSIGCCFGIITNCIGLFFSPMAEALGVGRGSVALISTMMSLSSAIAIQVIARLLNRRIPINILMGTGAVISIVGIFILSTAKTLPMLYICGILIGTGYTCYANLPVSMLLRSWYGEKNASKLGIAMAFSGVVAALMNPVLGRLITSSGYQSAFRVMAVILAVISLPATFTAKLRETPSAGSAGAGKQEKAVDAPLVAASTMAILIANSIAVSMQTGLNTHFSSYAVSLAYPLAFGATVVSFQNIFNSVWKLLYGFVIEKAGIIKGTIFYLAISFTGSILLVTLHGYRGAILAGVSLYATVFGISTVGCTVLTQKIAGDRYAEIYAKMSLVQAIFYALFTWVYGSLSDAAGNYIPCICIAMTATACCAMFFFLLGKRIPKEAQ